MSLTVTPLPVLPRPAEPEPDAGLGVLRTEHGNLPLHRLDVNTHITGLTARIEVVQGFHNPHDIPIEATYIFPLPARAAVTSMRMTADDRTVDAELHEREQARAVYDQAIAEGKRASIAEAERADVFTMRVGNILPGERVTVTLRLVGPLSYEDGEATLRIPLVVAPRFIPGEALPGPQAGDGTAVDTDVVPDASRISPPVLLPGFPNPVALSMETVIDPGGLPLGSARSSLHTVVTSEGADGTTVLRVEPGERVDRDFILRLGYGDSEAVSSTLAYQPDGDGEGGTFQLTVLPPSGVEGGRPRDVVVLLDRSGSMAGWKIVAARRAASRIIDTLTGADRFALRCFDHDVERPDELPSGLVEATDRNRYQAVEHLAKTTARGGTVFLEPLREAATLLATGAPAPAPATNDTEPRDRVLILVTDGQVGNDDQILGELGTGLLGVRVHVVGIDRAVNAGFLNRLASVGRGRCELVESEDRLDEATARIHRRIASPVVTDLSWQADGLTPDPATFAPTRIPDLFTGAPVVLSGRYHGAVTSKASLTLTGRALTGDPWRTELPANPVAADDPADVLPLAWARAYLRELEDRYAVGSGDLAGLEKQIVDISLKYSILCRFTAFVAVDSRVVTEGGQPHKVTQPVELPSGWQFTPPPSQAPPYPAAPAAMMQASFQPPPDATLNPYGAPPPAPRGPSVAPPNPKARARSPTISISRPTGGSGGMVGGSGIMPTPTEHFTPDHDAALRRQLTEELTALHAVPADTIPEHQRRDLLSDLGSRLAALLTTVGPDDRYRPLRDLVEELATCDGPNPPRGTTLDALWQRTLDLLATLGADSNGPSRPGGQADERPGNEQPGKQTKGQPTGQGGQPVRKAFWKRNR